MRTLILVAVLALAACGGSTETPPEVPSAAAPASACLAAFQAAAGVDEMADSVSDLYPAVRACASLAEWTAAYDAVGGAGFDGTAAEVLTNMCTAAEISAEPLCIPRETETSAPAASPAGDVLEERGPGVTLVDGDSGQADLEGGRYRVGWVAEGCTTLEIEWATEGGSTAILATLPAGETFVDLPAGVGSLDCVADCEYTIRFEAAN